MWTSLGKFRGWLEAHRNQNQEVSLKFWWRYQRQGVRGLKPSYWWRSWSFSKSHCLIFILQNQVPVLVDPVLVNHSSPKVTGSPVTTSKKHADSRIPCWQDKKLCQCSPICQVSDWTCQFTVQEDMWMDISGLRKNGFQWILAYPNMDFWQQSNTLYYKRTRNSGQDGYRICLAFINFA